jgi:hypothetical protein
VASLIHLDALPLNQQSSLVRLQLGMDLMRTVPCIATCVLVVLVRVGELAMCGAAEPPVLVREGLDCPVGVAVQPGTGRIFVAESGAGRVLRLEGEAWTEIITGFPVERSPRDAACRLGPLGLWFLDTERLLVAEGGQPEDRDTVRVFRLQHARAEPLSASDGVPLEVKAGEGTSTAGGDLFGVAATASHIFASAHGGAAGAVLRAEIKDPTQLDVASSYSPLSPFVDAALTTETGFAGGLTVSPKGELVMGLAAPLGSDHRSRLVIYRSSDGKPLLELPTGLHDLVALGYATRPSAPRSPLLYALDASWQNQDQGGLFRLDAALQGGTPTVNAVRLATFQRPMGMAALDPTTWLVTAWGAPAVRPSTPQGQLWRVKLED